LFFRGRLGRGGVRSWGFGWMGGVMGGGLAAGQGGGWVRVLGLILAGRAGWGGGRFSFWGWGGVSCGGAGSAFCGGVRVLACGCLGVVGVCLARDFVGGWVGRGEGGGGRVVLGGLCFVRVVGRVPAGGLMCGG